MNIVTHLYVIVYEPLVEPIPRIELSIFYFSILRNIFIFFILRNILFATF